MTDSQKKLIQRLRVSGKSYKSIAADLGLPEGSIKTYCYRNGLKEVNKSGQKPTEICECCGGPIVQTGRYKPRRFCSNACRQKWWNTHRDEVNRKGVYKLHCAACGKNFESYDAGRKFCSHACYINNRFGECNDDAGTIQA